MALGRVSAFKKLDEKPRAAIAGDNLTPSATTENPFASISTGPGDQGVAGPGPAAPDGGFSGSAASPSFSPSLTGTDPALTGMFGTVASLGIPGLGSVTGPALAGLGGSPMAAGLLGLGGSLLGSAAQSAAAQAAAQALGTNVSSSISPNVSNIGFVGGSTPFGQAHTGITGNLAAALGDLAGIPGFASPAFAGISPTGSMTSTTPSIASFGPTGAPISGRGMDAPMADLASIVGGTAAPSESLGFGSFTGFGGSRGIGGTGLGTIGQGVAAAGNPAGGFGNPSSTNFGGARASDPTDPTPDPTDPTGLIGLDPTGSEAASDGGAAAAAAGAIGEGPGAGGVGAGTPGEPGDAGAQGGPGAPGDGGGVGGGDGSAGTGGDSGGPGDFHEGGFVGLEQDGMGGDTRNRPDEGQKEVDATLEQGEFVVNKEAAGRFGPLLNSLNQLGRNKQLKQVLDSIIRGAAKTGFDALMR